jgi:hypothetical protein
MLRWLTRLADGLRRFACRHDDPDWPVDDRNGIAMVLQFKICLNANPLAVEPVAAAGRCGRMPL